uniref:Uncharacterized protein n=1 Tax=Rhizophora mucronata TaxID=61149 RepID=A0A2P2P7A4_RHIMU
MKSITTQMAKSVSTRMIKLYIQGKSLC